MKYWLIVTYGVVTFIVSASIVLLDDSGGVVPMGSPLWKWGWTLVAVSTLGVMLGVILIIKIEELRTLRLFKQFVDATFPNDKQREAVMRELKRLADATEEASQRVIALQRGGLKEIDRDDDLEHVATNFEAAYHNANSDFRTAQDTFYSYLDMVNQFERELDLRFTTRDFKSYRSLSPVQKVIAK